MIEYDGLPVGNLLASSKDSSSNTNSVYRRTQIVCYMSQNVCHGARLGRHEIERPRSASGMGEVYLADFCRSEFEVDE
jgi:hypothetical protein